MKKKVLGEVGGSFPGRKENVPKHHTCGWCLTRAKPSESAEKRVLGWPRGPRTVTASHTWPREAECPSVPLASSSVSFIWGGAGRRYLCRGDSEVQGHVRERSSGGGSGREEAAVQIRVQEPAAPGRGRTCHCRSRDVVAPPGGGDMTAKPWCRGRALRLPEPDPGGLQGAGGSQRESPGRLCPEALKHGLHGAPGALVLGRARRAALGLVPGSRTSDCPRGGRTRGRRSGSPARR